MGFIISNFINVKMDKLSSKLQFIEIETACDDYSKCMNYRDLFYIIFIIDFHVDLHV